MVKHVTRIAHWCLEPNNIKPLAIFQLIPRGTKPSCTSHFTLSVGCETPNTKLTMNDIFVQVQYNKIN